MKWKQLFSKDEIDLIENASMYSEQNPNGHHATKQVIHKLACLVDDLESDTESDMGVISSIIRSIPLGWRLTRHK